MVSRSEDKKYKHDLGGKLRVEENQTSQRVEADGFPVRIPDRRGRCFAVCLRESVCPGSCRLRLHKLLTFVLTLTVKVE